MKTLQKIINGGRFMSLMFYIFILCNSCETNKTFIDYKIQDMSEFNKIDRNVLRDIKCSYQNNLVVIEFKTKSKLEVYPDSLLLEFKDKRCMACDIDVFTGNYNIRKRVYIDGKIVKNKVFVEFRRLWISHDNTDYEKRVPVVFKILPCGFIKYNNQNVIKTEIEFGNEE